MAEDRRRPPLSPTEVVRSAFCPFAGKNIAMVDDDTLVELWRHYLKESRTSDAKIRRLSRLALLRYEDFRLQLIAWSLNPSANSLPNSAAMTSQLQHHEPVPRKDRAVPLAGRLCLRRRAGWQPVAPAMISIAPRLPMGGWHLVRS
jgi:hypothetical protein